MKILLAAALTLPMAANAALIEWVGTGPQQYNWEDQANPTATITILADERSIHSINISNTKTSISYNAKEIRDTWSQNNHADLFVPVFRQNAWSGSLFMKEYEPDFYPGDRLINSVIRWSIHADAGANPYMHLDQLTHVGVSSVPGPGWYTPEFTFTPTEWTRTVIDDGGAVTVPEPASAALLLLGLAGFAGMRRFAG